MDNGRMRDFNALVTEYLKIAQKDIADSLTPKDVLGWDSMNYLLFISELEKEYEVSFTMDEVMNAHTLGDIRAALRSKGVRV
jgi:acyl carrier protein